MFKFLKKYINYFLLIFDLEISRIKKRNFDSIATEIFNKCKIQPNVILDIGGHKGESVLRFQKIYPESFIFSFEPNLNLLPYSLKGITFERLCCYAFAVGRKSEKVVLQVHESSTGSSSLLRYEKDTRFAKRRNISKINVSKSKVKQISIDEFYNSLKLAMSNLKDSKTHLEKDSFKNYLVRKNNFSNNYFREFREEVGGGKHLTIDYLKIDVQGTELQVLEGATKLLKDHRILVIEMEVITSDVYQNSTLWSAPIQYLLNFGYRLVAISNDGRFFNKGPFDILENPELQFDVMFVNKFIWKRIRQTEGKNY